MPHAHGVDLAHTESGSGPAALLIHETATGAEVWRPLMDELGEGLRAISYDRRGWGSSEAPPGYARTTVEEHSEDAAALLEALDVERALLCGVGIGAVVALDLLLRSPGLVSDAILIEPPLLAFVPAATEGLSADRTAIEEALREGGPAQAFDLYLGGGLPFLGPGAERIPAEIAAPSRQRPLSLFAELGAVPSWALRPAEMGAVAVPTRIVVSPSTPAPLRSAAAELEPRLGGAKITEHGGEGLPQLTAAAELTALIGGLMDSAP